MVASEIAVIFGFVHLPHLILLRRVVQHRRLGEPCTLGLLRAGRCIRDLWCGRVHIDIRGPCAPLYGALGIRQGPLSPFGLHRLVLSWRRTRARAAAVPAVARAVARSRAAARAVTLARARAAGCADSRPRLCIDCGIHGFVPRACRRRGDEAWYVCDGGCRADGVSDWRKLCGCRVAAEGCALSYVESEE